MRLAEYKSDQYLEYENAFWSAFGSLILMLNQLEIPGIQVDFADKRGYIEFCELHFPLSKVMDVKYNLGLISDQDLHKLTSEMKDSNYKHEWDKTSIKDFKEYAGKNRVLKALFNLTFHIVEQKKKTIPWVFTLLTEIK